MLVRLRFVSLLAILFCVAGINAPEVNPMDFEEAQRQIDAILTTLKAAKNSASLGPNDPAVIELDRIMLARVAELEAAKTEAQDAATKESAFFAPTEDAKTKLAN
jgi:hypothetical protein